MLITIDVRMINYSGIGTYIINVVPKIISKLKPFRFSLLGDKEELHKYQWAHSNNVSIIDFKSPIYSLSEQICFIKKIPKDTDLFWSPHFNIPIFYNKKLLVTIHDVLHLAMPQYVKGFYRKFYVKKMFSEVLSKADGIIFNSNFTANEFNKYVGEVTQPYKITYLGTKIKFNQDDIHRSIYPSPYLLYVGNVKPHKNIKNLIRAFKLIIDRSPHHLVIVGKKDGFITGDPEVIEEAKCLGTRVHFTGHISDNLLKQYYIHATALVFPSFYEGFGLPPLEAMASGCPTLVANTSSLPEVCENACLYFDPNDPEDIATKIYEIIENKFLREEFREKGFKRAQFFTWQECTAQAIQFIHELLQL